MAEKGGGRGGEGGEFEGNEHRTRISGERFVWRKDEKHGRVKGTISKGRKETEERQEINLTEHGDEARTQSFQVGI